MKHYWKYIWIFDILMIPFQIYVWHGILTREVPLSEQVIPTSVAPLNLVSQPVFWADKEYCVLPEDNIDLVDQVKAGTPVPWNEVPTTEPIVSVEEKATIQSEGIPTEAPNKLVNLKLSVNSVGEVITNNYHIVILGVGYSSEENDLALENIISDLRQNFQGINVDFAYVEGSVDVEFKHIQQAVTIAHDEDYQIILDKIRENYPADTVAIAIKTPLFLGTSHGNFIMLTADDPNTVHLATHELGHQLGLGDGYMTYYGPGALPNSELFYLDGVPSNVSGGLERLNSTPPIFEMGTCNGRKVYTFYQPENNIMGNKTRGNNPWGASPFTPLQVQIMNDNIVMMRQTNK